MRKTVKSKGLIASETSNSNTNSGRLARRSPEEINKMIDRIVATVKRFGGKTGLRSEQIREHMGIDARELARPLRVATDTGRLVWDGQKRATTYYIP